MCANLYRIGDSCEWRLEDEDVDNLSAEEKIDFSDWKRWSAPLTSEGHRPLISLSRWLAKRRYARTGWYERIEDTIPTPAFPVKPLSADEARAERDRKLKEEAELDSWRKEHEGLTDPVHDEDRIMISRNRGPGDLILSVLGWSSGKQHDVLLDTGAASNLCGKAFIDAHPGLKWVKAKAMFEGLGGRMVGDRMALVTVLFKGGMEKTINVIGVPGWAGDLIIGFPSIKDWNTVFHVSNFLTSFKCEGCPPVEVSKVSYENAYPSALTATLRRVPEISTLQPSDERVFRADPLTADLKCSWTRLALLGIRALTVQPAETENLDFPEWNWDSKVDESKTLALLEQLEPGEVVEAKVRAAVPVITKPIRSRTVLLSDLKEKIQEYESALAAQGLYSGDNMVFAEGDASLSDLDHEDYLLRVQVLESLNLPDSGRIPKYFDPLPHQPHLTRDQMKGYLESECLE